MGQELLPLGRQRSFTPLEVQHCGLEPSILGNRPIQRGAVGLAFRLPLVLKGAVFLAYRVVLLSQRVEGLLERLSLWLDRIEAARRVLNPGLGGAVRVSELGGMLGLRRFQQLVGARGLLETVRGELVVLCLKTLQRGLEPAALRPTLLDLGPSRLQARSLGRALCFSELRLMLGDQRVEELFNVDALRGVDGRGLTFTGLEVGDSTLESPPSGV